MSEADVKVGFDIAERRDDLTNGKFDSTKKTAEEIAEIADQDISQRLDTETQEVGSSLEVKVDNAETEEEVEDTATSARKSLAESLATMVAGLGVIRNISKRQDAEKKINEAQSRAEQSIASKAKAGILKLSGLRRTAESNKNNNSIENLLKRSSLSGTSKNDEGAQLEDRAKLEKERTDREQELQMIRERKEAGKKITPEQDELLRQETIRIAEQKMRELNTMEQYRATEDRIQETVRVGRENAERQERGKREGPKQIIVVGEEGPEL